MSRKKNVKYIAKRKNTALPAITAQKLEKDFLKAPAKLAAQLNKEVAVLKQSENKFKISINKLKAQAQKSKNPTKTRTIAKNLSALTKQLQETTKTLNTTAAKKTKMIALKKHLSQFDKEWAKQSKTVKTKATSTSKPKKTGSRNTKKNLTPTAPIQQPQINNFENEVENIRSEDQKETTY